MASMGFTASLTTLHSTKFPTARRESWSSTSSVCVSPKPVQGRRCSVVRASLDDAAKKGLEAAKEGAYEIQKETTAAADSVGKTISDAAGKVQQATEDAAGKAKVTAEGAWEDAKDTSQKIKDAAEENAESTADATKAAVKDAAAKVDRAVS